jgi:hypothetical protein
MGWLIGNNKRAFAEKLMKDIRAREERENIDVIGEASPEIQEKRASQNLQEKNSKKMQEVREEREKEDDKQEGQLLAIHGAKVKFNSHMGEFKVLTDVPTTQGKLTGTKVEKQIPNFTFNDGFQMLSLTEWQDFGTVNVQDNFALLKKSTLPGTGKMPGNVPPESGKIEFVDSGQVNAPENITTTGAPVPENLEDNTEYIYYTKDGFYLGGNENSTKMYLSIQEEYDKAEKDKKWSLINKENNLLQENNKIITHLKLISLSATCYGECYLEYNVDVKRELYAIAYVHFHHPENVAYGANSDGAKSFKAKKAIDRNNKTMQLAVGASINAYINGFDFSYGADSWDGIDVLTGGSWNKWLPENHYRQRANGKNKGISDPKNISPIFYATAKKALEDKIASPKVSDKLKKDYKAKYAHLQPLIVYKENKNYKPLFEVVATYAVSIFYKTLK